MVCRSTPGNSAITTLARASSNLHDVQVLSLFHEARSEAPRTTAAPSAFEVDLYLDQMATRAVLDNLSERRSTDLRNRIYNARTVAVDGRTYYAWRNIEQRATFARAAMETHFDTIGRRHGYTPERVEAAFNTLMHRDHRIDGQVPQAPEHVPFSTDHLPRDRGTRYALAMLHASGPDVTTDQALATEVYEGIHNTSEHIAHNPHLNPANNCPDCGQFAGQDHTCPTQAEADTVLFQGLRDTHATALAAHAAEQDAEADANTTGIVVSAEPTTAPGMVPSEEELYEEAERLVSRRTAGVWTTPSGHSYSSRTDALYYTQARLRDAAALESLTHTLGHEENARHVLDHTYDFISGHGFDQYVTNDGLIFDRREDALAYAAAIIDPADLPVQRCTGCGQFVAIEGHTCVRDFTPEQFLDNHSLMIEEANQAVSQGTDGNWRTPQGFAYADHDLAVRSTVEHCVHQDLVNMLTAELGPETDAETFIDQAYRRLTPGAGRWETNDGQSFSRYEDAILHDYYQTINTRCDGCGQYMGLNHTCPFATPAATDALATDALAEWERELLRDEDTNRAQDLADQAADRAERVAQERARQQGIQEDAAEAAANAPDPLSSPLQQWEIDLLTGPLNSDDPRNDPPAPTPAPVAPVRRRNPLRSYRPDENTVVRTMNISAVRAAFREDPNETLCLDDVTVTMTTNETDTFGIPHATSVVTVTGSMNVASNGQRRTRTRDRFTVTPTNDQSLRCTCPDYQTNYDCEHVRQATEHLQAILNDRDPVAIAPAVAMENVNAALRTEYDASLAASQTARADFADAPDNIAYADNMPAFQTAWDEAKAHFDSGETALPYMYENATNGLGTRETGRSIGIEIEVDFPEDTTYTAKQRVAREIYEAGLSDSADVRPWHWRARQTDARGRNMGGGYTDNPNMWSVEFDRSVDDVGGNRGCEIVSPILYDTPETWTNLKKICDIVERHGGKVTPRTGLHINIGAGDFNHTVGNHNRLVGVANAYEDVIVRAAHNPVAGRQHRGREYCRPMTMPEEGFSTIRQAQRSIDPQNYEGSSHRAMINLDHVPAEGDPIVNSTRVEVRIFDGTIDPGRIQANVKMSLGMVNAAVRGVEVPRDQERAGTHRTNNVGPNGRMRRLTGAAWEQDTASFRKFVDTLFSREEDKKQLTYAFAASRWQRQ